MKKALSIRILIILLLTIIFFVFTLLCFLLKTSTNTQGNLYNVFSYLLIFIIVFYYCFVLFRIENTKLKIIVFFLLFLNSFFLFIGYIRNLSFGVTFSRYCFYLYFLPILFLPCLLLIFNNNIFYFSSNNKNKLNLALYVICLTLSTCFFALTMTNDLHHLIYKYDNKGLIGPKPLYFIMCSYCLILCCIVVVVFIVKTLRRNNIVQLFAPISVFVMIILYSFCLAKNYKFISNTIILKDPPMVYSLLFILFFEVLFSNGLIQNNGQYIKHFNSCMLPLKIIDDNGENIYTSQMFDEQSYYLLDNDKKLFTSMPILGGKIIIEEDISKLKELQNKLDKSIDELSQANEILMKRTSIENESIRLKIREQLYNEIDVEIAKKSKEIGDLVSLLPDEVNYANRNNAIDILSKIRLRIGYLKQKSLLILQSKIDNKVSNGDFNLFLNVITHDIKNLGFSSLVYTLKGKKNVPVQFALAINELMEYVGEYFANLNSYAFITCNINELKCSVRIETNEKITLPSNFKNPFIKKIGYDFKKKKSQNEYLLVVERGQ